jgi:hypothetical protein
VCVGSGVGRGVGGGGGDVGRVCEAVSALILTFTIDTEILKE